MHEPWRGVCLLCLEILPARTPSGANKQMPGAAPVKALHTVSLNLDMAVGRPSWAVPKPSMRMPRSMQVLPAGQAWHRMNFCDTGRLKCLGHVQAWEGVIGHDV